MNELIPRQLLP